MYLDNTSLLDLYFYSAMTRAPLDKHRSWFNGFMSASMGDTWFADLERDITAYRDTFDALLREQAETSDAIRTRDALMSKVVTWRSMMTSMARQATATRRAVLLQAAGYGLGSPSSVKEMKDFLVEVKARVGPHRDSFKKLGAMDAVLSFPAKVLAELEKASGDVAREKAEDSLARVKVGELHTRLVDIFEKISHAASAAADQGSLLDDADMMHRGQDLLLHLSKAMSEAKVESRKRAASGEVPADLMLENTTIAPSGEVMTTPGASTASAGAGTPG
ncbi:MAG: hypothetical protein ABIJ09_23245 [Pseudomonadota bacterium]